jgi:hypothetical protein
VLDYFRKKLQKIYFKEYVREVKEVREEPYQDLLGARLIDFIRLSCEHLYWQEKDSPKKFEPRICDTCLLAGLTERYGKERGWGYYNKWVKWGRVKG